MLERMFSDAQLQQILEQAAIYDCACPAQICNEIASQRRLYAYQYDCLDRTETDRQVHERIAAAVRFTHAELERCLLDVLNIEGWELGTLTMPLALQKRLLKTITDEG